MATDVTTIIRVRQSGDDPTDTRVIPIYPHALHIPLSTIYIDVGPRASLVFRNLDELDEWLTGVRHDTDVLMERRNRVNQQTLDGAA
jgi:hypothetical protein